MTDFDILPRSSVWPALAPVAVPHPIPSLADDLCCGGLILKKLLLFTQLAYLALSKFGGNEMRNETLTHTGDRKVRISIARPCFQSAVGEKVSIMSIMTPLLPIQTKPNNRLNKRPFKRHPYFRLRWNMSASLSN